jgi:hypothetical protein
MLTKNERLQIGWEILEKLVPLAPSRGRDPFSGGYQAEELDYPIGENTTSAPGVFNSLPSIQGIINQLKPLPPYNALLGVCEDGLPFMFDLSDPTPGSLLITGEAGSGKSRLLRGILASASTMNRPDQVSFNLICQDFGLFSDVTRTSHCTNRVSTYDRFSSELVIDLAKIAEQRKSGRQRGPIIILAIDDLATLLSYNEFELFSHLKWLVKYGPESGIWPIATLKAGRLNKYGKRLLDEFGTHLVGMPQPMSFPNNASGRLLGSGSSGQFETYVNGQVVRFWTASAG